MRGPLIAATLWAATATAQTPPPDPALADVATLARIVTATRTALVTIDAQSRTCQTSRCMLSANRARDLLATAMYEAQQAAEVLLPPPAVP